MSDGESAVCALCGREKAPHKVAEVNKVINHKFSFEGTLAEAEPPEVEKQKAPSRQQVIIAPAPDLMLRRLLVELEIVTVEQLDSIDSQMRRGMIPLTNEPAGGVSPSDK